MAKVKMKKQDPYSSASANAPKGRRVGAAVEVKPRDEKAGASKMQRMTGYKK